MEKTIAVRSDWKTEKMPFRKAKFSFKRDFSEEEIQNLKCGHIPQEMEDKWFWYMENDTLYAHRSWTGFCIYIVKFNFKKGVHRVTVNKSGKQYKCTDKKTDLKHLQSLLNWWVQPQYDYYHQWLGECNEALKNMKK